MAIDSSAKLAANIHSKTQGVIGRVLMIRRRYVLVPRIQRLSIETGSTATENDQRGRRNGSVGPRPRTPSISHGLPKHSRDRYRLEKTLWGHSVCILG